MAATALALVWQTVERNPDKHALRYLRSDRSIGCLSYKQVWDLSGLVAARLQGSVLAVAIDDGPYLSIAELAGWRRGMILVPLDPHDPVTRLQTVVAQAEATCIVAKDWGDAKKLSDVGPVVDLSLQVPLPQTDADAVDAAQVVDASLDTALDPEAAAYMWFTSGSTGLPKGVLVSHRAFHNWCVVKNGPHGISEESVVLIASASTFDPSIGDIFATWAVGGVAACAPRMLFFAHLGWAINQLKVTHVTCTPSLWQSLEAGVELPSLQVLCVGGERAPQPLLDRWSADPVVTLLNTYGTTECTVWQTLREVRLGDRATLVGSTYRGNEVRILGRDSADMMADGELGEIVQGGVQVGIGYHNRPELTAEKFLKLSSLEGRWYRTGDGGRMADGELEVMGRFDSQVKIRGMRVELGDIEAGVVAASHGLLNMCSVVLRDSFLHAYCQVAPSAAVMMHESFCILPVVSDYLLQKSSLELPRHMLPSRFVLMQHLPLTQNGKVDNKRLPEIVEVVSKANPSSLTPLERIVASVWEEVLCRSGIGPNDHFLGLGGHSVSVLQVSRKLLVLAASAGQDVSPASHLGMLLAPEKLIHSPRLRIYCQMLARGGVRLMDKESSEVVGEDEPVKEGDAANLRINYTKHKVKRPNQVEEKELDHGAWEQVPRLSDGEMLCQAAEAGLLPLVQLLLDQRASVEGQLTDQHLRHGTGPLHLAVSGNHLCCVEELLQRRADAKTRDVHGTPALHKAAERCGERMIELLVGAGADVEAVDKASRSTALHAAAKVGNGLSVATLVVRCFPDWLDRWNRSALHWAVFHGHTEICLILLRHGARAEGTIGERGGRFFIAAASCGNMPQKVKKQTFVTPRELARERFAEGSAVFIALHDEHRDSQAFASAQSTLATEAMAGLPLPEEAATPILSGGYVL
eukprot:TRINITY_DN34057_c0_g1_i2.p1 TRINITY_DN34057_c0_g1~~TRINITY_DN34057_c0_g1_i2.p1  ORF type:complete len:950 (-),score=153.20 TRINITY_DN34057_c0_g1_i2:257-3016(-)